MCAVAVAMRRYPDISTAGFFATVGFFASWSIAPRCLPL